MVTRDHQSDEARQYTEITGRAVDPAALALYDIRWQLDDIAAFVRMFRSAHGDTPDSAHLWQGLNRTLARVL
jgi:spectinomycin phosphotransferase